MSRRMPWVLVVLVLALFGTLAGTAGATSSTKVEATFESPEHEWNKVERLYDSASGFSPTGWPGSDTRMDQSGQTKTYFGAARPLSGQFLLYYGKNWSTNTRKTPVLLVPGAFSEADGTWADPAVAHVGCGVKAESCPTTGLMQQMAAHNYKTFGITFNNGAGDNYNWAENIYNAIHRIKEVTGAEKVDIVAWSKGTIATRMYVSSMKKSWGTSYAGDVRRIVLTGGMGGGWDWPFRHGRNAGFMVYPECAFGATSPAGGSAFTQLWCGGWGNASHPELSLYNLESNEDPFVGIRQMLRKLVSTHPLESGPLDVSSTYYGGWGYLFGSYSPGIDYALEQTPGSVIEDLRNTYKVPKSISTYLLCGTENDIPFPWPNEAASSDGTVFTDSCDDETGIENVPAGGNVQVAVNHLELPWSSTSTSQIESWLE